jgi:hypothetical protein
MESRVGGKASFEEKVKNITNFHGTHVPDKIFFVGLFYDTFKNSSHT